MDDSRCAFSRLSKPGHPHQKQFGDIFCLILSNYQIAFGGDGRNRTAVQTSYLTLQRISRGGGWAVVFYLSLGSYPNICGLWLPLKTGLDFLLGSLAETQLTACSVEDLRRFYSHIAVSSNLSCEKIFSQSFNTEYYTGSRSACQELFLLSCQKNLLY